VIRSSSGCARKIKKATGMLLATAPGGVAEVMRSADAQFTGR
jgi:hypothetical protein